MSPQRRVDLFLPRERRWPWFALAASLAIHVLLLVVRIGPWLPPRPPLERRVILVPLGTEGPKAVDMTYRTEPSAGRARRPPRTAGVTQLPEPETGPIPERQPEPDTVSLAREEPVDTLGDEGTSRRPGRARLEPALGEGKLWVRPLPLPPQDLARALSRDHVEMVDSAVTAIVQAYIDSVLNAEPLNAPLPSWTTRIGDQQIGLDARWIYLGPIKIPTALIAAFLPGTGSAETSDYTKFRQLQQMREDVQIAARRAQTIADFKRAIRELRAERERQREFAKNQRTRPDIKPDSTETPP